MRHLSNLLKDFYGLYFRTGSGVIVNHKLGAELYDKVELELHKVEVNPEDKTTIWKECQRDYQLFYAQHNHESKEFKKELLHNFYKSELISHYLNSMLKPDGSGQIISFDE